MATSGTYSWSLNQQQVVNAALRKLAVLPSGGSANTNQMADSVVALNSILKAFAADGMPLWAITNFNFNTVAGTSVYDIGIGKTLNAVAPLKVIQARRTEFSDQSPIPMNLYTRYDANILPSLSSGTPINLYYQKFSDDHGQITLWPIPDSSTSTIYIDYHRPFQDMVSNTDSLDFPSYWTQALTYNLAWSLSPEYGVPPTDRNVLAAEAKYWTDEARSYGTEEGGLFFQPETRWGK